MPIDSVVVLRHPVALASKRFTLTETGGVKTDSYGFGKYFEAEVVGLDGLDDLHALIVRLQADPRAFLIRGEPIPGRDLKNILRTKNTKDGEAAAFREYPRRWVMLDVDGLNIPVDWSTPQGCQAAADRLVGLLPMELRVAGYIWQVSASAGMKPGCRMHLFYFLDRPLGEQELTRWGDFINENAGRKILDNAVFRTIQPLYVAPPIFGDGLLDPVAQRIGYIPGAPASLPRMSARGEAWKRKLEPLYFESNDKIHDHVRDACASYFCGSGHEAPAEALEKALRVAIARAEELQGRQGEYNDDKIAGEIESGRTFARSRASAGENLLLDNLGNPRSTIGNVIAIMKSDPDWQRMLCWNTRHARIEIIRATPWGTQAGEWNDSRDSVLAAEWFVQKKRVGIEDGTILKAAVTLAREAEIDPVTDWLTGLEWDGQRRLDEWMIGWCGAINSQYVRRVSRMMLIGAVARALQPGCKLDTVTILQGKTGRKKSTLVEVLGGEWYASVSEEKDLLQKIHGPWFAELPELGPFRTLNYNHIKGFTSTRIDRFRAPYMRLPEDRPRTCVIVATMNNEGIGWQEDATSGRRFWPVDVGAIDLDAVKAARAQLFAEACVAFHAGELWWVPDPDDADFSPAQDAIYATDTWEDIIFTTLAGGGNTFGNGGRPIVIVKDCKEFRLSDLLAIAFDDWEQNKRAQTRAARALLRLGWTSDGRGVWHKVDEEVLTNPSAPGKGG